MPCSYIRNGRYCKRPHWHGAIDEFDAQIAVLGFKTATADEGLLSLLSYYLPGRHELINHFLLQPRLRKKKNAGTTQAELAAPWVEENGIIAQVIGGGPSLISDLINLIEAPLSAFSVECFLGNAATEGAFPK